MNCKYFAYCPESGFETFKTKKEAIEYAQSAIDYQRDYSDEGWSEETNNICWGEVNQCATEGEVTKITDENRDDFNVVAHIDGIVDYTLT